MALRKNSTSSPKQKRNISEYASMNSQWFKETAEQLTHILAAIMQIKPSNADRIVNASVAKLGVVGATAGVYGIASLVGTAGTGTAIGTLSGAAANSATLAWIGGSVFTGTIVVGGIAIVGGWGAMRLWKGKPRQFETLSEQEQNIVSACANLAKAFKEQAESTKEADENTMKVVIEEGLVPLQKNINSYSQIRNYKEVVTGSRSVGSRVRIVRQNQKLKTRISLITGWD